MIINTVKELQNSYLVNDSMTVPKDSTNSDYKKVQDWIAEGNKPDPEFTPAELLQNAKQDKIKEIEQAKTNAIYTPVEYNGNTFFTTEKANSNILGAIILDQASYNWLDTSGDPISMTVDDLKALAGLIAAQRSLVYNREATKLKSIRNARTVVGVNRISWET